MQEYQKQNWQNAGRKGILSDTVPIQLIETVLQSTDWIVMLQVTFLIVQS
jgi:hypothetical protein